MQEKKITSGGVNYDLDKPFFVLATQNPIEQEGTYSLPEAQLDRFLFNVQVMYPSHDEEIAVMKNVTSVSQENIEKVIDGKTILEFQKLVKTIPVADHIMEYVATIVRSTRPNEPDSPEFVRKLMGWGAGPRASINLIMAGKSRAALHGRSHVSIEDIQALCLPVLRHRVIPNFAARSEGMTSDSLIDRLLKEIPSDEKLYQR
jgi:MoxR-like ATPase